MSRFSAALVLSVLFACSQVLVADNHRLDAAATVVTEMTGNVEAGISPALLAKARCVVVIPGVKKAAVGFGGQYGRGYVSCRRDTGGWGAPGAIRIEGGSIGLQLGGAETDVILLVLNERGVDRLLASKFTVGADATVAAGPVGRQASAQTDATLDRRNSGVVAIAGRVRRHRAARIDIARGQLGKQGALRERACEQDHRQRDTPAPKPVPEALLMASARTQVFRRSGFLLHSQELDVEHEHALRRIGSGCRRRPALRESRIAASRRRPSAARPRSNRE